MFIQSLELNNFRNYNQLKLEFHEQANVFYGDNAQGKTNILESVFVCGTTKSHKGSKDREMIKIGENEAHIRMVIEKNQISHKIDMHLKKSKSKGVAIDGIPIKKSSELLGLMHIIFFSPEDLSIIKNGPSERRRFINMELSQLDKIYLYNLVEYNKVLNNRNKLLKQIKFNPELSDTLDAWDKQLLLYGSKIIERRGLFIEELKEVVYDIHYKLSGGKEELFIKYESNVIVEEFEQKLLEAREKDIAFATTNVGPHRDDLIFIAEDSDIRKFGSQGQQRTCALSLKLAEIEIVKKLIHDQPVLLLDDVLSELDRNRQNYLLDSINGTQTIITCTGLEEFINSRLTLDRVYKVVKGTVFPIQENDKEVNLDGNRSHE